MVGSFGRLSSRSLGKHLMRGVSADRSHCLVGSLCFEDPDCLLFARISQVWRVALSVQVANVSSAATDVLRVDGGNHGFGFCSRTTDVCVDGGDQRFGFGLRTNDVMCVYSDHSFGLFACSHPTSCASMAEIMSVLFFNTMKYKAKAPRDAANDRFVLSKVMPDIFIFLLCNNLYLLVLQAHLLP